MEGEDREKEILVMNVGIELGAMYTRAGVWNWEEPLGEIPSLLAYSDSRWVIGNAAKECIKKNLSHVVELHDFLFGYKKITLGEKQYSPEDVLTIYLKELRIWIEKRITESMNPYLLEDKLLISVAGAFGIPGNLQAKNRETLRRCCKKVWPVSELPEKEGPKEKLWLINSGFLESIYYYKKREENEKNEIEEISVFCDIGYGSADICVIEHEFKDGYLEDALNGTDFCTGKRLQNILIRKMYKKYPFLSKPWPGKYDYMKRLEYAVADTMASFPDADPIRIPFPTSEDVTVQKEKEAVFSRDEVKKILQSESVSLAWEIKKTVAEGAEDMSEIAKVYLTGQMTAFEEITEMLSTVLKKPVEILEDPGNTAVRGAMNYIDDMRYEIPITVRSESGSYMMYDSLGNNYCFSEPQGVNVKAKRSHIVVPEDLEEWTGTVTYGKNPWARENSFVERGVLKKEDLEKLHYQFDAVLEQDEDDQIHFYVEEIRGML